YATIQQAIGAASSGATIEICPGTYFEHVRVAGKTLTLEGAGADATILDGSGAGIVISAQHGTVLTVRGITIQHGNARGGGGGISAGTANVLTVEDSVVSENHADGNAGGIAGPGLGSAYVTRTIVRDNDAGGSGGGAPCVNRKGYGTVIIESEFRDNHADGSGGGLGIWTSLRMGRAVLTDTVIDGNS